LAFEVRFPILAFGWDFQILAFGFELMIIQIILLANDPYFSNAPLPWALLPYTFTFIYTQHLSHWRRCK
jgi:hypothetical protein